MSTRAASTCVDEWDKIYVKTIQMLLTEQRLCVSPKSRVFSNYVICINFKKLVVSVNLDFKSQQ